MSLRPLSAALFLVAASFPAPAQESGERTWEGATFMVPTSWTLEAAGERALILREPQSGVELRLIRGDGLTADEQALLPDRPGLLASRRVAGLPGEAFLHAFVPVELSDGPAPGVWTIAQHAAGTRHRHTFVVWREDASLCGHLVVTAPPGPGPKDDTFQRGLREAYAIARSLRFEREPAPQVALGPRQTVQGLSFALPASGWRVVDQEVGVLLTDDVGIQVVLRPLSVAFTQQDRQVWAERPGVQAYAFVAPVADKAPEGSRQVLTFTRVPIAGGVGGGALVNVLVGEQSFRHLGFAWSDPDAGRSVVGFVLYAGAQVAAPAAPLLHQRLAEAFATLRSLRFESVEEESE